MSDANDVWGQLWRIATGESETADAIIEVTGFPGHVVLEWPDGSRAELYWHNGRWCFEETRSR